MNLERVIQRARDLMVNPRDTWLNIKDEPGEILDLYRDYLWLLAIVPAVSIFIGQSLVKYRVPFEHEITYVPIGLGLSLMLRRYILYLLGILIGGICISWLSGRFHGASDLTSSVRLVGYSATPGWLATALHIIPRLGDLSVFGYIFGIYLFYLGAEILLEISRERLTTFTTLAVVMLIVISIFVSIFTSP